MTFKAAKGHIHLAGIDIQRQALATIEADHRLIDIHRLGFVFFPQQQHMATEVIVKVDLDAQFDGGQHQITAFVAATIAQVNLVAGLDLHQTTELNPLAPVTQQIVRPAIGHRRSRRQTRFNLGQTGLRRLQFLLQGNV